MFYINAQENSQLVMGSERDGRGGIADSSREYNTPKHLKEWDNVASRLNNDGMLMVKEMARLSIRTRRLIGGDNEKNMGKG